MFKKYYDIKKLKDLKNKPITVYFKSNRNDIEDLIKQNNQYIEELIFKLNKEENKIYTALEFINKQVLPYGDEYHWDDPAIRDYILMIKRILSKK